MCYVKHCADKLMYAVMEQITMPNVKWSQATDLYICLNPHICSTALTHTPSFSIPMRIKMQLYRRKHFESEEQYMSNIIAKGYVLHNFAI